jgi:hypothetical protein
VKSADVVLVVEQGRLTQMGTHEQLMREDGHYREIARAQLSGDSEPRGESAELPSHMDRVRDPRVVAAAKGDATHEPTEDLEASP